MARILEILDSVLDEVRKRNPFELVLKGGTALAIHHLRDHRESEDLDFDADLKYLKRMPEIESYIVDILEETVRKGRLKGYEVKKKGFASTNRYHMNILLSTYKPHRTKIDLDFVQIPDNLEYEGKLGFYSAERMFVGKLLTYESRKELKDIYDIAHLLRSVEARGFKERKKVAELVNRVIESAGDEALATSYERLLDSIDLRFKNLRSKNVKSFLKRTLRELRVFRNELLKGKR